MDFVEFRSTDKSLYEQSVNIRNKYLYNSIGCEELDEDHKIIEKDNFYFGILDKNRLIGTVSFFIVKEAHIQLVSMCIDKEYQGNGFGKLLIEYAISEMKKKLGNNLLISLSARHSAYKFYEKLGFVSVGDEFMDENKNLRHKIYHLNI